MILCLFIHNSTSKHSCKTTSSNLHKHHFSEMSANNCFQFWLSGPSLWAIVDFLALKGVNSNNLLSEAVVCLKSSNRPNLYSSQPQNLCHSWKHIWCYRTICKSYLRNYKPSSCRLKLFYRKSCQKQFFAFLKAPRFLHFAWLSFQHILV